MLIGLLLLKCVLSPDLKIGITLAIFKSLRTVPHARARFIISKWKRGAGV